MARRSGQWLLGALTLLGEASAEEARETLVVDVPSECGSQADFESQVAALQTGDGPAYGPISVRIQPRASGEYELEVLAPRVHRLLVDADCTALFRSAIVIAAAAARGEPTSVGEPGPEPAPSAGASTPPAVSTTSPPAPAGPATAGPTPPLAPAPPAPEASGPSPVPSPTQWRLGVLAGGGVAVGLSPDWAPLLELAGAVGARDWGGSIALRYLPRDEATTRGEVGLQVESYGGRLGVFHEPTRFVRLELGLSGYRLTAQGVGIRYPRTDSVWLIAPEAELVLVGRPSDQWSVELGAHGRIGVNAPQFRVEPQTRVYQLPRFGAGLIFRVQWRSG